MKNIIANFKMNFTNTQIKDYLIKLISRYEKDKVNLILCLPYTALSTADYFLSGSEIKIGAQNLSDEDEGKNTGEISGIMLKDCGVSYVIVGHSERRSKFRENGKIINKKIKMALKNSLKVIFCVGESLAEKNSGKTAEVIKAQLEDGFKGLYENELENIIIAYEPVWAIGSGKTPLAKEIDSAVKTIKKTVENDFSLKASEKIEIVYGGSVDNKNFNSFTKIKGINGLLIGGASLDPINLCQIVKEIK